MRSMLSSVGATLETLPACSRRKSARGGVIRTTRAREAALFTDTPCHGIVSCGRAPCFLQPLLLFALSRIGYLVKEAWRLINAIHSEL